MNFVALLEAGCRDFLEATSGVSEEQARRKARAAQWSVLECVEHVVLVEERYQARIRGGAEIPPERDTQRELRLFTMVRNRLTKVTAPEGVLPSGRFLSLAAAVEAFRTMRARSLELVQERGDGLYAIGAQHPFFGKVNAAEIVQLMDAHARRHADQIRQICEACETMDVSMKSAKPKKAGAAFKRDQPDLPGEFGDVGEFANGDLVSLSDVRLREVDHANLKVNRFQMEGCVLEHVRLTDGQFGNAVWKDVRLIGCDLANVRAHRISLLRVELIDCRLTGFRATALDWQDVLIQNGDARYAQMENGKFRTCEFNGCDLQDADLQGADLSGSVMHGCNLARADLRKAKLRETDFRRSAVDGMVVEMTDMQGAIVDAAQAMVFARLMGLQIK